MQIRKEKLNVTSNSLDIKSKYHQHSVLTLEFRMNYYFVKKKYFYLQTRLM